MKSKKSFVPRSKKVGTRGEAGCSLRYSPFFSPGFKFDLSLRIGRTPTPVNPGSYFLLSKPVLKGRIL
jgi:hypothetical protein